MTNEEKQLLLKDLCARLPYGVMVENILTHKIFDLSKYLHCLPAALENFKPYLRPMSSMTEEEKQSMQYIGGGVILDDDKTVIIKSSLGLSFKSVGEIEDYLNQKHFDYRGLIKKGLALEAKEGMYTTE